jgi:hypothetical protein
MPHFAVVTADGVSLGAFHLNGHDWPPGSVITAARASRTCGWSTCCHRTTRRSSRSWSRNQSREIELSCQASDSARSALAAANKRIAFHAPYLRQGCAGVLFSPRSQTGTSLNVEGSSR